MLPASQKPPSDFVDQSKVNMWLPQHSNSLTDDSTQPRRMNSRISDSVQLTPGPPHGNPDDVRKINSRQSEQLHAYQNSFSSNSKPQPAPLTKSQRAADNSSVRSGHAAELGLNQTASSLATFVDDGRSVFTTTTLGSSNRNEPNNRTVLQQNGQQSIFSDAKTPSMETQDNFRQAFAQSSGSIHQPSPSTTAYIPSQHKQMPRVIQSNHDKQRNIGGQQQDSSQSSNSDPVLGGVPENTQINDRLQLLKSTFKYKNSNIEGSIGSGGSGGPFMEDSASGATDPFNNGNNRGRRRNEVIDPPDY